MANNHYYEVFADRGGATLEKENFQDITSLHEARILANEAAGKPGTVFAVIIEDGEPVESVQGGKAMDTHNPAERIKIGAFRHRAVYVAYAELDRIAHKHPESYLGKLEIISRCIERYDGAIQSGNEATVSRGTASVNLARANGNSPWYYVSSSIE